MPSAPRARTPGQAPANGRGSPSPDSEMTPLRPETPLDARELQSSSPTPDRGSGKMRAARNASTPVSGSSRQDRRFWPRDTRGLLELCEQGYALQQGMKSHCQETADIMEGVKDTCESTAVSFLEQMQKTLSVIQDQSEKPATVDWAPMFQHLEKITPELAERVASNQETTIQRLETHMEVRIAETLEAINSSKQREEEQGKELQEMRREIRESQAGTVAMEELLFKSQEQFKHLLLEQTQMQSAELRENKQDEKGVLDGIFTRLKLMEPMLKAQLSQQLQDNGEQSRRNHDLIGEISRTVHGDILNLFSEIGQIQRALHIHFLDDFQHPRGKGRKREGVRMRDSDSQTGNDAPSEAWTQTDQAILATTSKRSKKNRPVNIGVAYASPRAVTHKKTHKKKQLFADEESLKAKMRLALIRPEYNVLNEYHDNGCFQHIARSHKFEHLTFVVILLNALWISVDTDYNDASLLYNADPIFQVAENAFCLYFFTEVFIRFWAFRRKCACFHDFWFVFDSMLVCCMVIETWVITGVLFFMDSGSSGGGVGGLSILRTARLVKLLRMGRMVRLLRMVPELMVIVRGIGVAFRSVLFFLLLTVIIVYVFAVAFTQLTKGTAVGGKYFPTVPFAMNALFLNGMLPLYENLVNDITAENPLFWPAIMVFIVLASITVMNMLVGVLVEVVRTVAATEKEGMTVTHLTQQLRTVMTDFHRGAERGPDKVSKAPSILKRAFTQNNTQATAEAMVGVGRLQREDFQKFIMQPDVALIIQDVGVDVVGLIDMADMIYEDKVKQGRGLEFPDFIDVVLNMRGTNPSTVKDVKQQMRVMKNAMAENSFHMRKHIEENMDNFRVEVMEQLLEIRRMQGSDAGSDDEEKPSLSKLMSRTRELGASLPQIDPARQLRHAFRHGSVDAEAPTEEDVIREEEEPSDGEEDEYEEEFRPD